MHILFYAPGKFHLPRKLFQAIHAASLSDVEIEQPQNWRDLQKRLKQMVRGRALVILSPGDSRELRELNALRDHFANFDLILIIPDGTDETIALAHRLRPRFICHTEDYAEQVGDVALNILRRNDMNRFSSIRPIE